MSIENAKGFYEKVISDQSLQQKISKLAQENHQGVEAEIIKIAGAQGFEFTEAEMKSFTTEKTKAVKSSGELNENELEMVAGGKGDGATFESVMALGINC